MEERRLGSPSRRSCRLRRRFMMGEGEEGAGLEGEQVKVDCGNWEKKAVESVTKKLESNP